MKSIVEKIFYGNLRPNDDINKYAEKEVQEMLIAEKSWLMSCQRNNGSCTKNYQYSKASAAGLKTLRLSGEGLASGLSL